MVALLLVLIIPAMTSAQGAGWPSAQLLTDVPIRPVALAVAQARRRAPIPKSLRPGSASPVGSNCLPSFGPGTKFNICSLGDARSRHLVVLLGDSHAAMWIPGFVTAATELDVRLVPLAKPGCAMWALHANRHGWPCLTWWREALAAIRRLHPSATVVSFMTGNYKVAQANVAANEVQSVLQAVPHPIVLADPPSDEWYVNKLPSPEQCMSSRGANIGRCALHVTPDMTASLTQIQSMLDRDGYPAIPTLQWFCAEGICPTVIDRTVTTEDGNHITPQYAQLLGTRLAGRLGPILKQLWSGGAPTPATTSAS